MLETSEAKSGRGPTERSADRPAERDRKRGLGGFVRRRGLVSFYTLAFGPSWLAWLPFVLSQHGLGVVRIPFPEVLGTAQFAGCSPAPSSGRWGRRSS